MNFDDPEMLRVTLSKLEYVNFELRCTTSNDLSIKAKYEDTLCNLEYIGKKYRAYRVAR